MESPRDELFASSGLAADEHGAHVGCEAADEIEQLLHRRTSPDHAMELEPGRHIGVALQQALAPTDPFANRDQQLAEPSQVEGLGDVVERSGLDGFDRRVDRRVAGHEDHLAARFGRANSPEHLDSAELRHLEVYQRDVRLDLGQTLESLLPAAPEDHFEPELVGEPFND